MSNWKIFKRIVLYKFVSLRDDYGYQYSLFYAAQVLHIETWHFPFKPIECFSKSICLSEDQLTHTLTHTGKSPYGTSGTKRAKEDTDSNRKGLKIPIQRQLKGLDSLRNQQVARSSRVTSSRKSP